MTQRCGLKPNEEEYILMGMSAYGEDFRFKTNLHKGCMNWRPDLKTEQDYFDIAAGTQIAYEILFRNVLELSKSLVKSDNLVLMGGCALNCSANPIAYNYYNNVWIMPAPGDNGSSIGAALAYKKKHIEWVSPYLGFDMGYTSTNEEIVDYLLDYKICGIARGKAEFGPRALGNRSLIADPRDPSTKDLVNSIKKRQKFRPFAPVILEEYADDYFEGGNNYMQFAVKCKSKELTSIQHVDGTSRVQILSKKDNPIFHDLLLQWYNKTGCPLLLNTSLNIKGFPIVNSYKDVVEWEKNYQIKVFS
jgi:carbamoyltransferase